MPAAAPALLSGPPEHSIMDIAIFNILLNLAF
jgi:hypothetical protein